MPDYNNARYYALYITTQFTDKPRDAGTNLQLDMAITRKGTSWRQSYYTV